MTNYKRIISIKKVIKNTLGKNKAEKYLKGIEIVFSNTLTSNSMDIYQYALAQLMEGETEKALNCIIFALDFDRENKLTLHLCKTMLFSLTQYLQENKIEELKSKHGGGFDNSITRLKKKVKEMEKVVANDEAELEKLQKSMLKNRSNPFFLIFKKGKLKQQIQAAKTNLYNLNSELDTVKLELKKIDDLMQKEECIKVVGLIIEVCVFPSRFDPDLAKTNYI